MTIRILISSPPAAVQPNRRNKRDWRPGYVAGKKYEKEAAIACRGAMAAASLNRPRWVRARIDVVYYVKDRRYVHDRGNLIASLKKAEDGLVVAGLLADDQGVEWGAVEHEISSSCPAGGRLELRVTEING